MSELTVTQIKDLQILADFIKLYCHAHHDRKLIGEREVTVPDVLRNTIHGKATLCPDCAELLEHGIQRRAVCPLDPKPTCRNCHIHCYTPLYRQRIRKIMAYSGRKMILRGRLDYLWHYFIKS
jgi:hypothetical protein